MNHHASLHPSSSTPGAAPELTVGLPRTTGRMLTTALLVGPALTVLAIGAAVSAGALTALSPQAYLLVALVFWSPLPFSVPAVLLEAHRDAALPHLQTNLAGRSARAVLLLPWLMTSPRSGARAAATASLVGFCVAVALAAPSLLG